MCKLARSSILLSHKVNLFINRYDPGGGIGALRFIYRVPSTPLPNTVITKRVSGVLDKIEDDIPIYHTRVMIK